MEAMLDTAGEPRARPGRQEHHDHAGFTLVELMVSLSVLLFLLGMAAPSFSVLINNSRVKSSTSALASDLGFARSEAIMRNVPVLVCAKSPSSSNCTSTVNWQSGWLICVDANDDGACDTATASAPNPIRMRASAGEGVTVSGPATALRFNGTGSVMLASAFSVVGRIAGTSPGNIQVATTGHVHSY